MIQVTRAGVPPDLDGAASPGGLEIEVWRAYFQAKAQGEDPEKPKDFAAYKRAAVRSTLEAMFHGKCAYCESEILSVAHGDIEHFRPKKAVKEVGDAHPGYWWLAARWENLLLSCTLCNQPPGKGTKFPVADEGHRASQPGLEAEEEPLLIDPSREDPAGLLEVVEVEESGKVRALLRAKDPAGAPPRGQTTIEVFRLNRPELVDERTKLYLRLTRLRRRIRLLTRTLDDPGLDAGTAADVKGELRDMLAELKELREEKQQFVMLVRHVVDPFLTEMGVPG